MHEYRAKALRNQHELCQFLHQMLEAGKFIPAETEQSIQDRRSFITRGLRMIHQFSVDMEKFPFMRDHVGRDWQQENNRAAAASQPSNSEPVTVSTDLKAAIDDFERCHWNRRVAKDDFEY